MSDLSDNYSYVYDLDYDLIAPCDGVDLQNFGRMFLPTLYSLVFIVGFLGNGLVVCILVKHRSQSNLTDIFLLNLALSDLLFVCKLPFFAHYSAVTRWTFGAAICHLMAGCHYCGFFSSIFFMVVMTLDRYMFIMHPHRMAHYRNMRVGLIVSAGVWLLSLCVSIPALVFTQVTDGFYGLVCIYNPGNVAWKLYNIFATSLLGLVVPMLAMVVCYARIIPTLLNMRSAKKYRVVKLIVVIVVVFFLFWFPYNLSLVLSFLQGQQILSNDCQLDSDIKLSVAVTESLAYAHCCLNPIIYAFVGQKFMTRAVCLLRSWVPRIRGGSRGFTDSTFSRKSSVQSSLRRSFLSFR